MIKVYFESVSSATNILPPCEYSRSRVIVTSTAEISYYPDCKSLTLLPFIFITRLKPIVAPWIKLSLLNKITSSWYFKLKYSLTCICAHFSSIC